MVKYSHKSQKLENALDCDVIITFKDGTVHKGHLTDANEVIAKYNFYDHSPYYLLSFCERGWRFSDVYCLGFYKSMVKQVVVKRRFKREAENAC